MSIAIMTNSSLNVLAWLLLSLSAFVPLFSFNGPTPPPTRLASDAQPLCTAYDCVNVISGRYFVSEPNLTLAGPAPTGYSIAYDAGSLGTDNELWGWGRQIPLRKGYLDFCKKKNQKVFEVVAEEVEGATLMHSALSHSQSQVIFGVRPDMYDYVGYTNVCGGCISGQNNLHNVRATYQNFRTEYKYGYFIVTNGSGSKLTYLQYKFGKETQWRLSEEVQPNGYHVHYEYYEPQTLKRIYTTTPSGHSILHSIDFHYDDWGYTAKASNGQSVRYNVTNDTGRWLGVDRKIRHLQEMVPSDGVPSTFYLCKTKREGLSLQTMRRDWQEGRFLNIIHREPDGKVAALQTPLGSDATPITMAAFHYGPDHTIVTDALGTNTVYRYSANRRITSIDKCQNSGQVYTKKHFLWDLSIASKGNLLATASTDQQSAGLSATAFTYDGSGNVITETLFGNLTGQASPTFSIGADLKPTSATDRQETRYQYSSDDRNLRIQERHSNDLRITYAYKPGTNLLTQRITGNATELFAREFHSYDDDSFLIRTVNDDGIGGSPEDLQRVTVRTIKEVIPRKTAPAIGFPDQEIHKYWDPQSRTERQLRRICYTYNAGEQVVQEDIYDAQNQLRYSLTYAYDEHRNLVAQTNALGQATVFTYDINKNKLSEELIGSGVRTNFRYDLMNRVIAREEVHADGTILVTSYRYDVLGNKVAEVDAFGNEIRFVYDEFSRLIDTIGSAQMTLDGVKSSSLKQSYNSLDHCVSQTDAIGNVSQMTYTVRGQLVSKCHADGTVERNEYSVDGLLLKHWNTQGVLTQYRYDTLNRPLEKNEYAPDGKHLGSTRYEYWGSQLVRTIDPRQVITEYAYDGAGRKCVEVCCDSRKEYVYDALGRLSHTKSFFGSGENDYTVAIQDFDLLDRVIADRVEDATGTLLHKKAYRYDIHGNRTHEYTYHSETDYTVDETCYNSRKQPIQQIDALGHSTFITYDLDYRNALGQRVLVKTTTDPLGQQVIEEHDASGRLVASVTHDSFGNQLAGYQLIYDLAGNVVRRIDDCWGNGSLQRQRITDSSFDAGQRITLLREAVGTSDERSTQYSYNRYGQLETIRLPDEISLHHTYDGAGRLATYRASDNSFHYQYSYDAVGNLLQVVDVIHNTLTTRFYNGLNRITTETLGNGLRLDYAYDRQGRITQLTLPDTTTIGWHYVGRYIKEIFRQDRLAAAYTKRDLVGNVLEMQLLGQAGHIRHEYDALQRAVAVTAPAYQERIPADGYDAVGNLLKHGINDARGHRECRYQYDALYQLSREDGLRTQNYAYDSLFNRLSKDDDRYSLNGVQALLQAGTTHFTNDARGNPVERRDRNVTTFYQYDALGRLTMAQKGNCRERYLYDSFNRRLSARSDRQDSEGNWHEQHLQHFLYTDQNEIGCADGNGIITQLRILGDGRGAEIGAAVAIELDDRNYAPIHDLRGNVVALVDHNGLAVETMQYSAFGEEYRDTTGICPWHFSSKRLDKLTGFTCFGRRYYDAGLGRWLTPDPIGYKAGPNLYAYVNNAPLTHFDLYGLYTEKKPVESSRYDFWRSPRFHGTLQACGGVAEGVAGAALASTPLYPVGLALMAHGADQFAAGSYTAMNGVYRKTFTEMGLQKAGLSESWASFGNDLISVSSLGFVGLGKNLAYKSSQASSIAALNEFKPLKFKPFTKANCRHNLGVWTGTSPPKGMDAHHILAQKFNKKSFNRAGLNIHHPRYLTWWDESSHRSNAKAYNLQWENYLLDHPEASRQEYIDQAKYIMSQFGQPVNY